VPVEVIAMPYPPQGIGGAGVSKLSELIIDADKNWNNKRIMNLGAPTADSDAARFDSIPMPFGDGRDGDVTITSNTTLSRDMYYRNLTVNAGASLDTNNYSIFVSNKLTVAGKIHADGRGGAGGGGGCVECIGGYNILAENGSPGTSQNITLYLGTTFTYTLYTGGGGGGGGATCYPYDISCGGSGGGGGGIVKIFASYIVIQSGGVISANGLNGGNASGYGNSGGGGGGGGGTVFILYRYMVNNGSITANGGAGGSGIYCCSSGYFPVQPKAGGAGGSGAAGGSAGTTGNPPTAGGNGASSASGGGGGGGGGGAHTGNGSGASGGAGGNGAVILRRIG